MAKLETLQRKIFDDNNNVIGFYEVYPRTTTMNIYDTEGNLLDVTLKQLVKDSSKLKVEMETYLQELIAQNEEKVEDAEEIEELTKTDIERLWNE